MMKRLGRICTLALFLVHTSLGQAFVPKVKHHQFESSPTQVVYFENTSTVLYLEALAAGLYRSKDDGESWEKIDHVSSVQTCPYEHYLTNDHGETWHSFSLPNPPAADGNWLNFHSEQSDSVIFKTHGCRDLTQDCPNTFYYTSKNFDDHNTLQVSATSCTFTHASPDFKAGHKDTIICQSIDGTLVRSTDHFATSHPVLIYDDLTLQGVRGLGVTSKFIFAAFAPASIKENSNGGTKIPRAHQSNDHLETALAVSTDGVSWDRANFSGLHDFKYKEFTVLESSTHSLHVDVASSNGPSGDLFMSDSTGTKFTRSLTNTRRNRYGIVDVEKVQNVDGVLISSVNYVMHSTSPMLVPYQTRTEISFDDGRTWDYLKVLPKGTKKGCDGDPECGLNLHSVTEHHRDVRVFSSVAPGVLLGVGNVGKALGDYYAGDLYVSTDSGLHWTLALEGLHRYEFVARGNVLVAVPDFDENPVTQVHYSFDRGQSWHSVPLPTDKVGPVFSPKLLTTLDATSQKLMLIGTAKAQGHGQAVAIALDFTGHAPKPCVFKDDGSGDFEKWYARYDMDGKPSCVMGHKEYFFRKKVDSDCFVDHMSHTDVVSRRESCDCMASDFECDYGFLWDEKKKKCSSYVYNLCDIATNTPGTDMYTISSGYRLVPGNDCKRTQGSQQDQRVGIDCRSSPHKEPANKAQTNENHDKAVKHVEHEFKGGIANYVYLSTDFGNEADETILLRTDSEKVFITHDQGGHWDQVLKDHAIIGIVQHTYEKNRLFLVDQHRVIYYSGNRGKEFKSFQLPAHPSTYASSIFKFNAVHPDWIIYHGSEGCMIPFSPTCINVAYISKDSGQTWSELKKNVNTCTWVTNLEHPSKKDLIICEHVKSSMLDEHKELIASTDFFTTEKLIRDGVRGFAVEESYIIAATDTKSGDLRAYVSTDGDTFAEVRFPSNFNIKKQQAYTVLETKTHSIFLHVTVSDRVGGEYGSLLRSNSNGTDYVLSLENVNRNSAGFVDFEKAAILEGVALANVVSNVHNTNEGRRKKLKTVISFNDGGQWDYIHPPAKDSEGKAFSCEGKGLDKCSLNLHGYTEKADYRDTKTSTSAVGLLIAVGNVGDSLSPYRDGSTFMTRDGGQSWKMIRRGPYMWEFGDQGSVIVLVNGHENTNTLIYSLDQGESWHDYQFSKDLIRVKDIATIPSDSSRKFVIFAKPPVVRGDFSLAIQIDFSDLFTRKCQLDPNTHHDEHSESGDFEFWTLKHPKASDEDCFMGHKIRYYRKKEKATDCFVGKKIQEPVLLNNCSCTRQDYECDFNYHRVQDGTCHLVPGYSPPDHKQACHEFPDLVEYWIPTGYRKLPLSTCQGGHEFEKVESLPCPGHEADYESKRGRVSGFALFLIIVLPIGMAGMLFYIVWDHYTKRYGQIRLGEEGADQPMILLYMTGAAAACVSFVSLIPHWISAAVDSVRERLFATSSYRQGLLPRSRNYRQLADDEDDGELLGIEEDSFEEDLDT